MSFTKNDQAVVLNRESLQYLANCIRLVHSLPDLLNDVLPSQTTTYSSYKVTELLNTLNTDLQNYVNNALGNLSHLKKEIVSVTPTDSSADEDTIYLVQDASGGYEQYLKINGVVTSLGSTSAINNVYTKTESDAKFALLSTLNSLITAVGGLNDLTTTDKTSIVNAINELKTELTSMTSHTNDADIHITTAERTKWNEVDNKVDKTDIVSVLDSTVTNNQLVDGKTLVDKFNSIEDNLSRRYNFDDKKSASIVDRKLAIKSAINSLKKDGTTDSSIDYYGNNLVFLIRYNGGYYYTYIMTSYMSKVFIQEYSPYATDMNFWLEDEMGELYIRGTIPMVKDIIRIVNPFTTNKDKYKLYEGKYTIDENTKTCTLTVSIDCLSPASVAIDVGSLNTLNFKTPSSPRTFDLKAEDDSTNIMRFYLGSTSCQIWLGTAGKRYTGTVTYTIK